MLRCQAQLELTLIFGALSDRSTFISIDARATDLTTIFFWRCCCHQRGSVTSSIGVLAAAGDVLTQ
jgi:hypothetical protein